ncbi:MurR/RpiR family transcriptional regulator [Mesorhizobium australafricanum]|uniref:MurR/RpiR family transcriptional regulator n=1 Tax=Mesorhizobium australafricanum TaxID=3072311 RepID=A0ABU4WVZ8_9HYPH|nr:MurR/RpiR family transcriptional regulator [Mesorhizobium sp. VK3E]MDX8440230.1 MurR/RpiR family transcriptional regulator [Mesorhizobium sp. VK3E]
MAQIDHVHLRPANLDELRVLIASRAIRFPEKLKRITEIALREPYVIAFGSAKSIASHCSVSPSTVLRLVKHLGFVSLRELKAIFQKHLQSTKLRGHAGANT